MQKTDKQREREREREKRQAVKVTDRQVDKRILAEFKAKKRIQMQALSRCQRHLRAFPAFDKVQREMGKKVKSEKKWAREMTHSHTHTHTLALGSSVHCSPFNISFSFHFLFSVYWAVGSVFQFLHFLFPPPSPTLLYLSFSCVSSSSLYKCVCVWVSIAMPLIKFTLFRRLLLLLFLMCVSISLLHFSFLSILGNSVLPLLLPTFKH